MRKSVQKKSGRHRKTKDIVAKIDVSKKEIRGFSGLRLADGARARIFYGVLIGKAADSYKVRGLNSDITQVCNDPRVRVIPMVATNPTGQSCSGVPILSFFIEE